jgi:hypothetical protein
MMPCPERTRILVFNSRKPPEIEFLKWKSYARGKVYVPRGSLQEYKKVDYLKAITDWNEL